MAVIGGLNQVLANLNKEFNNIKKRSLQGLIEAGILIIRDMEKVPPKIPVDVGNLRNSRFMVTSEGSIKRGGNANFKGEDASQLSTGHSKSISDNKEMARQLEIAVIIGFSANYAWYVHEMLGVSDIKQKGKKQFSPLSKSQRQAYGYARFKRPGSGPKFLEAALKRNVKNVLDLTGKNAKIP